MGIRDLLSSLGSEPSDETRRARVEQAKGSSTAASWIGAGESIEVHGLKIDGGLVYFGRTLPSLRAGEGWDRSTEPALIAPHLPVNFSNSHWSDSDLGYWPAYSRITPASRAAYLQWLAGGRRQPDIAIGYVFLFFYGLERRAIADSRDSAEARADLPDILAETDRLISTYGTNGSFRSYAESFRAMLEAMVQPRDADIGEPPIITEHLWEMPIGVRISLARLVNAGLPLSAEWALTWLRASPSVYFRTPAQRCPQEFDALWRLRYVKRFAAGLVVKPNKKRLALTYHPASASFGDSINFPIDALPDITALEAPVNQLRDLANECEAELEPYSRYIGKHREDAGSLPALALLPKELLSLQEGAAIENLRHWAEQKLAASPMAAVDTAELLVHWPPAQSKPSKAEALSLVQLLGKFGYGIEPDVRFGGKALTTESVVLFRLPDGSPTAPSTEYSVASLLLHLAAAVAIANGRVSPSEQALVTAHLEDTLLLEGPERTRINAHLSWLFANGAPLTGLTRRVQELDNAQSTQLGHFLISVAAADGSIRPAEVRVLERIYELLSLDTTQLYSDIQAFGVGGTVADRPVTIRPGQPRAGFDIPSAVDGAATEVKLNMAQVEKTLGESAKVAALLGDIFADDSPTGLSKPAAETEAIEGLDGPHSRFLRGLQARIHWERDEIENLAAECALLPDGALDTVNEFAYERAGAPVWVGDNAIDIEIDILQELVE